MIVASAVVAAGLPPETLQAVLAFLRANSGDILSFAAPFPELRMYLAWIIDYFDAQENTTKEVKND